MRKDYCWMNGVAVGECEIILFYNYKYNKNKILCYTQKIDLLYIKYNICLYNKQLDRYCYRLYVRRYLFYMHVIYTQILNKELTTNMNFLQDLGHNEWFDFKFNLKRSYVD